MQRKRAFHCFYMFIVYKTSSMFNWFFARPCASCVAFSLDSFPTRHICVWTVGACVRSALVAFQLYSSSNCYRLRKTVFSITQLELLLQRSILQIKLWKSVGTRPPVPHLIALMTTTCRKPVNELKVMKTLQKPCFGLAIHKVLDGFAWRQYPVLLWRLGWFHCLLLLGTPSLRQWI